MEWSTKTRRVAHDTYHHPPQSRHYRLQALPDTSHARYPHTTHRHCHLRFVPSTNIDAPALLEQSEIDLAMGALSASKPRLQRQTLFTDHYVCAMRKQHPLTKRKLTLDQFVRADHLLITLTGEATGVIDRILREKGLQRRIMLTVNQFSLAPEILANSDLIAPINYRSVQHSHFAKALHLTELPLDQDPIHVCMMWHDRKQRDAAHEWLRSFIVELCTHL